MIKLRKSETIHNAGRFTGVLFTALCSFILTGTEQSRLNAAAAGALPPLYSAAVLVGAISSYCFTGTLFKNMIELLTLIFSGIVRCIFFRKENPVILGFITTLAMALSGTVMFIAGGFETDVLVTHITVALMAGFSACFIAEFCHSKDKYFELDEIRSCSLATSYILLISSLCSMEYNMINLGCVFGSLVTLSAAYSFGCTGGGLCGTLTAAGIMLYSTDYGIAAFFIGLSGFACGFFGSFGKAVQGIFFTALSMAGMMIAGSQLHSYEMQANIALGAVLFIILPVERLCRFFEIECEKDITAESILLRLENISGVLNFSAGNTRTIAEHLDAKHLREYGCKDAYSRRMIEMRKGRKMVLNEMYLAENILSDLRKRFEDGLTTDFSAVCRLEKTLCSIEADYYFCTAYRNRYKRLFLEVVCDDVTTGFEKKLCKVISKQFGRKMKLEKYSCGRGISGSEDKIRLVIKEKPPYSAVYSSLQRGAEEISGDTCDYFTDDMDNGYFVISDGMGRGKEASLTSKMAVSTFRNLIINGVEWQTAVKMVNDILISKSVDESFATLDIAKVCLDSGRLTLIKYGASATVLRRGRNAMCVNGISFPIGIMEDVKPFCKEFDLTDECVMVMVSDGVSTSCYPYISSLLMTQNELSCEEITAKVCDNACIADGGINHDDITVMSVRLMA